MVTVLQKNGGSMRFPMLRFLLVAGLVASLIFGLFTQSLALGISGLFLFLSCGIVWHRTLPPVFPFALAYQWLFSVIGPILYNSTGFYPGGCEFGELDKAVIYSQIGFVALALGMRVGCSIARERLDSEQDQPFKRQILNRLFVAALLSSTAAWLLPSGSLAEISGVSQIESHIVMMLTIPFIMLALYCLQHRTGLIQFGIAFVVAWLPAFASQMSAFSYLLLVCTVCLLSFWRPWSKSPEERSRSKTVLLHLVGCAAVLAIAAIIWNGSIKSVWRSVDYDEEAPAPLLSRLSDFEQVSQFALSNFQMDNALEETFQRFSSDVAYFSLVLARVPAVVPHADGEFTTRALQNVAMPRFLFPDKGNLGSDSEATMTYAGINAASDEQGTSIGMGYMAYFYIDFGFPGMFVGIFLQGLFWGAAACVLWNLGRNYYLSSAAFIIFSLNNCIGYGSDIAKSLGGAMLTFLVFGCVLMAARRFIVGSLFEFKGAPARADVAIHQI